MAFGSRRSELLPNRTQTASRKNSILPRRDLNFGLGVQQNVQQNVQHENAALDLSLCFCI